MVAKLLVTGHAEGLHPIAISDAAKDERRINGFHRYVNNVSRTSRTPSLPLRDRVERLQGYPDRSSTSGDSDITVIRERNLERDRLGRPGYGLDRELRPGGDHDASRKHPTGLSSRQQRVVYPDHVTACDVGVGTGDARDQAPDQVRPQGRGNAAVILRLDVQAP